MKFTVKIDLELENTSGLASMPDSEFLKKLAEKFEDELACNGLSIPTKNMCPLDMVAWEVLAYQKGFENEGAKIDGRFDKSPDEARTS